MLHSFLKSAVGGGEWSTSRSGGLYSRSGRHLIRNRVGATTGLDVLDGRKNS